MAARYPLDGSILRTPKLLHIVEAERLGNGGLPEGSRTVWCHRVVTRPTVASRFSIGYAAAWSCVAVALAVPFNGW